MGGNGFDSTVLKEFWNSPKGAEARQEFSRRFTGYQNPDFQKRWKHIYEFGSEAVLDLVLNTNIPDRFIVQNCFVKQKVKFDNWLRYHAWKKDIEIIQKIKYQDYLTSDNRLNHVSKTLCSGPNQKDFRIYKVLISGYLDLLEPLLVLIQDESVSDSAIYIDFDKVGLNALKYFVYLDLIKPLYKTRINIRALYPRAQRATGTKTIYEINNGFVQWYHLIRRDINELFSISFDGRTIQFSRC